MKKLLGILAIILVIFAMKSPSGDIQYSTAKSGRYSEPSTWLGKKVPPENSSIRINPKHTLTLDRDVEIKGIYVPYTATLTFDNKRKILLESNNTNIVIDGR